MEIHRPRPSSTQIRANRSCPLATLPLLSSLLSRFAPLSCRSEKARDQEKARESDHPPYRPFTFSPSCHERDPGVVLPFIVPVSPSCLVSRRSEKGERVWLNERDRQLSRPSPSNPRGGKKGTHSCAQAGVPLKVRRTACDFPLRFRITSPISLPFFNI